MKPKSVELVEKLIPALVDEGQDTEEIFICGASATFMAVNSLDLVFNKWTLDWMCIAFNAVNTSFDDVDAAVIDAFFKVVAPFSHNNNGASANSLVAYSQ